MCNTYYGLECAPLRATVRHVRLTSHAVLCGKMRPPERITDRCWSAFSKTRRVLHDIEPVSPSARRGQSTVYMTITRIRDMSWKQSSVQPGDDEASVIGGNGWRHLHLVSLRVHWVACTLRCDKAVGDRPCYYLGSPFPRLSCIYSTILLRLCAKFWTGCSVVRLLTKSAKSRILHDMEGTALQCSVSEEWGNLRQWDIIVALG